MWSQGREQHEWAQLLERVTAQARRITIFLEVSSEEGAAAGYFDDVLLLPYPCQLKECKPEEPQPQPERVCVNFDSIEVETTFDKLALEGLTFSPASGLLQAVSSPNGHTALGFTAEGMRIDFPTPVEDVSLTLFALPEPVITHEPPPPALDITAYAGSDVLTHFVATFDEAVREIGLSQSGITAITVAGGSNRAGLIEVCYRAVQGVRTGPIVK